VKLSADLIEYQNDFTKMRQDIVQSNNISPTRLIEVVAKGRAAGVTVMHARMTAFGHTRPIVITRFFTFETHVAIKARPLKVRQGRGLGA
jgi:hypothetical protein